VRAAAGGDGVRIVTYNILKGGSGRTGPLAAVLAHARPDLVLLQEATDPDVVTELARGLQMGVCICRPGESVAALSRLPVREWHWHRGAGPGRAFLELRLQQPAWRVFAVHLSPYFWWWREQRRRREVRRLLELAGTNGEALLAGDFNAIAPEDVIVWQGMPLRVRVPVCLCGGRVPRLAIGEVLAAGYRDAATCELGRRSGFTIPAVQPKARLDYLFASPDLARRLAAYGVVDDVPETRTASDHLAVMARFRLPEPAGTEGMEKE